MPDEASIAQFSALKKHCKFCGIGNGVAYIVAI